MPILLYTYLATEMLAPFFASLLILNGILFLGKLVPFLDIIFNYGIDFPDFIRLCAYIIPNLLLFSIPMASMIGVIIAFTKLSNENEIMALKAAGIGLYKMLPPVLIFALFTASLASLSSIHLIPSSNTAMRKMLFQLAKEKIDKGLKEKQFSEGINNVVLYVDTIDKKNMWHGVYVADLRQPKAPLAIVARSGSLDARIEDMFLTLRLQDGTMHRSVDDLTQTIQFKTYTLNLPIESPKTVDGNSTSHAGKGELSLKELRDMADEKGTESPGGLTLLIEYHKRLALPVGCFILSLLGLPLALQSRPGQRSYGFPIGLSLFILYYILITAAKSMSENQTIPLMAAMWGPNVIFAALACSLIRASALETTSTFAAAFVGVLKKTGLQIFGLWRKNK